MLRQRLMLVWMSDVDLLLVHRLRFPASIKPTLDEHLVFAAVNTWYWAYIGLMLFHRLRRWPTIKSITHWRMVFTWIIGKFDIKKTQVSDPPPPLPQTVCPSTWSKGDDNTDNSQIAFCRQYCVIQVWQNPEVDRRWLDVPNLPLCSFSMNHINPLTGGAAIIRVLFFISTLSTTLWVC